VAQVGIAGSCKVGDGVVVAGQVGLADNIEIGDGTVVGAKASVFQSVGGGQQLFGTPAIDKMEAFRIFNLTRRLPKMVEQLKQLSARVEELEAAKDDKK
jgi:UDP-3-O-[3-hydroxymyristoyl] glucosamine N-acyltransferase